MSKADSASRPSPNSAGQRAIGLFVPLLVCAAALVLVCVLIAWGGPEAGWAGSLAPIAVLLALATLGLGLRVMSKVQQVAFAPAQRLEKALDSVAEDGVVAVSGLRDTGMLQGVVRSVAAVLEDHASFEDSEGQSREVALRGRLETLLRDLHDGILICTLDHQVLLYNKRALDILHVTGVIGLDRPVFDLLREKPLRHALTRLLARFEAGRHLDHDDGLSMMVIAGSADGRSTIKGRFSLMMDEAGDQPSGYVMTFEDVTNALSTALYRERMLFDVRDDLHQRLGALVEQSAGTSTSTELVDLQEEVERLDALLLDVLASAWPMSAVFSTTLFQCVQDLNSEGRNLTFAAEGDPVWLHCDSASITDLIERIANRLAVHYSTDHFRLIGTLASDGQAFVDLLYTGSALPDETLAAWITEPLEADSGAVTAEDVLHRHRTRLRVDESGEEGVCRVRLPLTVSAERYERTERSYRPASARSEFYDFDLLHRPHSADIDVLPLRALTCVVFDTETTGLEPSKGDEIISIGAVRIVNGRLLRGEIFNEFVHPGRSIPAASTKIHGITDDMVANAPGALETLPRFHRFVGPAALIAHNAAFDMKFLALKEAATDVRFNQPVLDTLLLAAHALGRDETLSLDGLSERFGIELLPEERHTALGDAIATAEVFLKLLPLLEAKGVRTLGEAQTASDRQVGLRRMQEQF